MGEPHGRDLSAVFAVQAVGLRQIQAHHAPQPKALPGQIRGVADVIAASRTPLTEDEIAERFTGRRSGGCRRFRRR
jgi:hypothetical protein